MGAVFVVLILLALSIKAITLLDRENIAPVDSRAVPDSVDLDSDSQNSVSITCLLYTSQSPRHRQKSRKPSSA